MPELYLLVIVVFVVIAGGITVWRCDGLSEAEAAAIDCGALVGDWEVYVTMDGRLNDGRETLFTGGVARFSLDGDGRVFGEDVPTVREGPSNCRQSGAIFTLNAGESSAMDFELTAPGELRQVDRRGTTGLLFRKTPSSCRF